MAYDYRRRENMIPGPRGPVPRSVVADNVAAFIEKKNPTFSRPSTTTPSASAAPKTPPATTAPATPAPAGPITRNASSVNKGPGMAGSVTRNLEPPTKQTSFTNADAEQYKTSSNDSSYTPIAERLASYQRGIAAFQDLGEAREADSMGISQERYRQQKDRRQFGKENAAKLTEQRRGLIADQASRQQELDANAPQRQAQVMSNENMARLQDVFAQMAQETDPAKIQQLYMQSLAMQGKSPEAQFDVARGGQETVTDPVTGETKVITRPDVAFNRFTGDMRSAPQAQDAQPDVMAEAQAAIAAGADKAAVNARLKQMGLQEIP